MNYLRYFSPLILFVSLFVGSGVYYTLSGVDNGFYQISPLFAIIPAIVLAWIVHHGNTQECMDVFLDGVRNKDIIIMCIIFLLSGAFSELTTSIGSVQATVNFATSLIPSNLLLIGIFLTAAFISTAIGTSMSTIATITPIAIGISAQTGIDLVICTSTVIGGAMFGDNLSIISDTTIASVVSQGANAKDKLKLNFKIAIIASIITIAILFFDGTNIAAIETKPYSMIMISPYIVLILFAIFGVNIFISLIVGIIFTVIIAYINDANYSLIICSKSITKGFENMHEITILSLMIGGLSGFMQKGSKLLSESLSGMIEKFDNPKIAQLFIAKVVSIFDILFANNTIAIIFSGNIVKNIAQKHKVPPYVSAMILDVFSCVFQGILPYAPQVLLASSMASISPLSITPHVYYCYALGIVSLVYIFINKHNKLR